MKKFKPFLIYALFQLGWLLLLPVANLFLRFTTPFISHLSILAIGTVVYYFVHKLLFIKLRLDNVLNNIKENVLSPETISKVLEANFFLPTTPTPTIVKVKLEDIKGKEYKIDDVKINYKVLPVLAKDGLPVGLVLPTEVVNVINDEYKLKDYQQPLLQSEIVNFLTINRINVEPFQSAVRRSLIPSFSSAKLGPIKVEEKSINSNRVIKYFDGRNIVAKIAPTADAYESYLDRFKSKGLGWYPTRPEFEEWHNDYVDRVSDLLPLEDVDDFPKIPTKVLNQNY